ncbi:MAG: tRNA modification GTPase, partial [Maribacter sp.]|nr:tRNA modification GTPase [Maribacter sp.]
MKKLLLITLLLFFSLSISAQINYEPGYFINNEGQRTSCLIRNVDWKNNPTSFEYKLSENSDSQKASIETVIEFGIVDEVRYERHTVKINRSSDDSSALERDRSVDFKEEQLFLKVLVEGEATLYYYENKNLRRFFFNPQNSHLEQLVYKRYRKSATEIRENTQFKQQLWNNFQCESISRNEINKLSYKEDNLVRLFRKFNVCINPDWVEKIKEKDQFIFNLSI